MSDKDEIAVFDTGGRRLFYIDGAWYNDWDPEAASDVYQGDSGGPRDDDGRRMKGRLFGWGKYASKEKPVEEDPEEPRGIYTVHYEGQPGDFIYFDAEGKHRFFLIYGRWYDDLDPTKARVVYDGDAKGPRNNVGRPLPGVLYVPHFLKSGKLPPPKYRDPRVSVGHGWKPRHLVKMDVGEEMAADQDYWQVMKAWKARIEPWGAESKHQALFEWKHSQRIGTDIEIIPQKHVKSPASERLAIEQKIYETWDEAVEAARKAALECEELLESDKLWTTKLPDRKHPSTAKYIIAFRGANDPERQEMAPSVARKKGGKAIKDQTAKWRRELLKKDPEQIMWQILRHMADGKKRTFNRIGVEMIDKTADNIWGTPFEEAMWLGVEWKLMEYRNHVPILFRITAAGKKALKTNQRAKKNPKVPTTAQARKKVEAAAKKLVGVAPNVVTGEINKGGSESFGYYHYGSFVATYRIGPSAGAHVSMSYSDSDPKQYRLEGLGFGFDKLTDKARKVVQPILEAAGAPYERFRIGKDWSNSHKDAAMSLDDYALDVLRPVVQALGKRR